MMSLTPDQVLRAAVASLLDNIDQHKLAFLYGVNQGRINEAAKAMEWASQNVSLIHRIIDGKAKISDPNGKTGKDEKRLQLLLTKLHPALPYDGDDMG